MKINVTSKELDYLDLKWGKEIREELNFYNLLKWMKISNKKKIIFNKHLILIS